MKRYTYTYRKASQRIFIGKYQDLVKELELTGEILKFKKKKKYYIGYNSVGIISEIDTKKLNVPRRKVDAKPYIRYRYQKKRVTEADFKRLADELNNGEIDFDELYELYGYV